MIEITETARGEAFRLTRGLLQPGTYRAGDRVVMNARPEDTQMLKLVALCISGIEAGVILLDPDDRMGSEGKEATLLTLAPLIEWAVEAINAGEPIYQYMTSRYTWGTGDYAGQVSYRGAGYYTWPGDPEKQPAVECRGATGETAYLYLCGWVAEEVEGKLVHLGCFD